ncbi:MAG TPA: hypothetical protein VGV37_06535 [Aliidongia sp.]|uniref:hypothetical protein n=1 Tax=Aliidongia sp. TaxID=1914230 RepID=UPI002DDCDBBF|nr:hypothetical protein [Aliidongia sp.]HEV2674183.1 hypothetical protein [Aliidongia sp.]
MTDEIVRLFPNANRPAPTEAPQTAAHPADREMIELLEHLLAESKRGTLRGAALGLLWRGKDGEISGSTTWAGEAQRQRYVTAGIIRELDQRFADKALR